MSSRNVLVVGNGAREHALVWKLAQSPRVGRLWCAPGNAGTAPTAENVPIPAANLTDLVAWCTNQSVDLVVVGPEEPLAHGLVDRLNQHGIPAFGPTAAAARIEASKQWAKTVMAAAGVPTAVYAAFDRADAAWDYARHRPYPVVLKADGLAAGKGVVVARTPEEAHSAIVAALVDRAFGDAGSTLLVEDFLAGEEVSLFAITDGETVLPLLPARDHKRADDGDVGPNTGGMGAFAPARLDGLPEVDASSALLLAPIITTLRQRGIPYRGVLYAGVMLTADGPRVFEFNCRLGDPEAQVILPLLDEDLVEVAFAAATGTLSARPLRMHPGARCGVVLASGGYPNDYRTGLPIDGLDQVDPEALIFHAGTRRVGDTVTTAGGRVLTVVGCGDTLAAAHAHAYANVARIRFPGMHYRTDIGKSAV
jgi:phosphoribosylamine--glycine ligase